MTTTYEPGGLPPATLLDTTMAMPPPQEELDLVAEAGLGEEGTKAKRQVLSCTTCRKRKVKVGHRMSSY